MSIGCGMALLVVIVLAVLITPSTFGADFNRFNQVHSKPPHKELSHGTLNGVLYHAGTADIEVCSTDGETTSYCEDGYYCCMDNTMCCYDSTSGSATLSASFCVPLAFALLRALFF